MTKRSREDKEDSNNNFQSKRKKYIDTMEKTDLLREDSKKRRQQRIELLNKRKAKQIANIHDKHNYLSTCCGMVNFSPEYIQYLKESYPEKSYLGKPDYKCKYCDAIFWINERNENATKRNNKEVVYSNCCKNGKIKIPKFRDPPTYLKNLLNRKGDKISRHFLQKIRQYNSMFAFTSMGGNINKKINRGEGLIYSV